MAELASLVEIFASCIAPKYLLLHTMEAFGHFQNALRGVGQPSSQRPCQVGGRPND